MKKVYSISIQTNKAKSQGDKEANMRFYQITEGARKGQLLTSREVVDENVRIFETPIDNTFVDNGIRYCFDPYKVTKICSDKRTFGVRVLVNDGYSSEEYTMWVHAVDMRVATRTAVHYFSDFGKCVAIDEWCCE